MCQKITQIGDYFEQITWVPQKMQTTYTNLERVNDTNFKKSKKALPDLIGFFWETQNFMMYSCNYVSSATI